MHIYKKKQTKNEQVTKTHLIHIYYFVSLVVVKIIIRFGFGPIYTFTPT